MWKSEYNIASVKEENIKEYYMQLYRMINIITKNYDNAKIVSCQTIMQPNEYNNFFIVGIIVYKYIVYCSLIQKLKVIFKHIIHRKEVNNAI